MIHSGESACVESVAIVGRREAGCVLMCKWQIGESESCSGWNGYASCAIIRRMLVTPGDRRPLTRSVTIVSVSVALAQSFMNSSDVECKKNISSSFSWSQRVWHETGGNSIRLRIVSHCAEAFYKMKPQLKPELKPASPIYHMYHMYHM